MTSKALGYILDSLATSESFTVPAALLDPDSKIDKALLDEKALVKSKDFLSEIPCPFGCGNSEPVRKGVKDGKPFYHGRCTTLKKYWTVPPEEVELLAFDKAAFDGLVQSGKITAKSSVKLPPNRESVPPQPKEDPNAFVHLVQKTISDKRGMKYNLAQIEMDILFALPERSPWQFLRVLRLMETTVFNATTDFDPNLSQRRWFREGLLILTDSPYANRPRSEQDVSLFKDELCEGLANFLITLVKWRQLREKSEHFAEHKGDALTRAIRERFAKMPTDLERTEKIKKYLYKYLIYDDEGIVRYHGRPFLSLLEACMGTGRPCLDDIPKDVQEEVCKASTGFYECNYGGWTDSVCDEWIEKTITTIDLARQRNERDLTADQRPMGAPPTNIEFQKKLYCERFKVSKDFKYIYDSAHPSKDYPSIQNLENAGTKVIGILKTLFAEYGKKRTSGWVYSKGGSWGPHFGKPPYSLFKGQQIAVRKNSETNKYEWRIIPFAEFDEESPIGLHSKRKNHSNLKNNF